MSLHQRIPQSLSPQITHLARYSRPRQPPSASKSAPRTQTRAFQNTPRRLTTEQPPSPKTNTRTAAAEAETTATSTTTTPSGKLDRILNRLPKPLQRYTSRLRSAPVSHVVAFLILHEITAIIPLLGLFGLFHYYTPTSASASGSSSSSWAEYILTHYGSYVSDGIAKFERYFTRKGWFGFGESQSQSQLQSQAEQEEQVKQTTEGQGQGNGQEEHKEEVLRKWESGNVDGKYRILVEIALAYALTKALLPVRIVASVSATPWFAGVLARLRSMVGAGRRKP